MADAADQARLNFNLKFNLRAAAGKPRASPVPSWAGAGPGAGATNPAADPAVQVSRARRGRGAGAEISLAGGPRKNPPACGSPVPQGLLFAFAACGSLLDLCARLRLHSARKIAGCCRAIRCAHDLALLSLAKLHALDADGWRLDLSRARVFKTIETRPEAPTVIPVRRGSHMNLIDHSAVEELFLLDLAWCNCKANKRASPR